MYRLRTGARCRYLLYEPENGELYKTVEAQFPPSLTEEPESFKLFHEPVKWAKPDILWPVARPWWRWPWRLNGEAYAILYSGASNNRHTNDLEFLYRVLVNDYGWSEKNIYVLNYNGSIDYSGGPHPVGTWPGDSTAYQMTVNASRRRSRERHRRAERTARAAGPAADPHEQPRWPRQRLVYLHLFGAELLPRRLRREGGRAAELRLPRS